MPVVTKMWQEGVVIWNTNRAYHAGGDVRKRWGAVVAIAAVDLSMYEWRSAQGMAQAAGGYSVAGSIQRGDRWGSTMTWSAIAAMPGDTLVTAVGNLSVQARYRAKSMDMEAALHCPSDRHAGWMLGVRRRLGQRVSIGFRGENYSRSDIFFSNDRWIDRQYGYTWTMLLNVSW